MSGELWYVCGVWCVLCGGLSGVCGFGLDKSETQRVVGVVSETWTRAGVQVGSGLGSHVRARWCEVLSGRRIAGSQRRRDAAEMSEMQR